MQTRVRSLRVRGGDFLMWAWLGRDLLEEYGVRLNVIGKTELLPESVQRAAQKAESITKHNNRAILNILMPYTASDEIATAAQSAVHEALLSRSSSSDPP